MVAKTDYIKKLAGTLSKSGSFMTFDQLANDLNKKGFQTTYGTPYSGGRGVARLVDAVYQRLDAQGLTKERDLVAYVFTNANGDYAYD